MDKSISALSRRAFLVSGALAGGGLVVGLGGCAPDGVPDSWRQTDPKSIALNAWVRISPDNIVTMAVPRCEMGQGTYTSLPMLLAEELEVELSSVRVEHPEADGAYTNTVLGLEMLDLGDKAGPIAHEMTRRMTALLPLVATGGSTSVRDAWEPLRIVGAATREMLVAAAANVWSVAASECRAVSGRILHAGSNRELRYGELAAKAALLSPPENPVLKPANEFRLIGKPAPRIDIPDKVTGKALFGIDVVRPDMLYASIRHAPAFDAKLQSFDAAAVMGRRGIVKVVKVGEGVAVVADSWWRANEALKDLPVKWTAGTGLDSAAISKQLSSALDASPTHVFETRGDGAKALGAGGASIAAEYTVPYLAHACMEPMNATAIVEGDTATIWTGSQSPTFSIWGAAAGADVAKSKVRAHTTLLGGGFGRRSEQDFEFEAGVIARAVPGKPVKLIWSREEDMRNDVYRPAALARFNATLDGSGMITAMDCRMASQSVAGSFGKRNMPLGDFGAKWNSANAEGIARTPYDVPNLQVAHHMIDVPVPVGYWRSVGHSQNAFFIESFIDECAAKAGQDPVDYRRKLLATKPRLRAVLDAAAARAGWGSPLGPNQARGVALHQSFGSIVAEIVEVTLTPDRRLSVDKVICVVDCGAVVNPDIVAAQMESGIIFGLTAALHGEISIRDGGVEQENYSDYDMVRLAQSPRIDVHIMPSSERPGGVGEPATPPIAPALANAIFAASGARVRALPLSKAFNVG